MPSPFPGMDPYLERHWLDVHATFVTESRRALNRILPKGLAARTEERIAIESDEDDEIGRIGPDVRVFSPSTADPKEGASGIVIEAPYKMVVDLDPITERFLRIIDESGTVITVVEFLSPSNKRQPGMDAFRNKRDELLAAGVHLVEIDLVRAGDWRSLMLPQICPPEAVSVYRAVIRTADSKPAAYLFDIRLRNRLPEIPIPLRPGDATVKLPLQTLFDAVYDDGRYAETLDYARPLNPPLSKDDAAWVEALLSGHKRS